MVHQHTLRQHHGEEPPFTAASKQREKDKRAWNNIQTSWAYARGTYFLQLERYLPSVHYFPQMWSWERIYWHQLPTELELSHWYTPPSQQYHLCCTWKRIFTTWAVGEPFSSHPKYFSSSINIVCEKQYSQMYGMTEVFLITLCFSPLPTEILRERYSSSKCPIQIVVSSWHLILLSL